MKHKNAMTVVANPRRYQPSPKRGTNEYAAKTIRRLEVFSDRKLPTDMDVWEALQEYRHALLKVQADDLFEWLRMRALMNHQR